MAAARELVIWRGSQFSSKAIAALRVKGFLPSKDYKLSSAPMGLEERKKLLPAPYTVPVLRWDGEVVAGSDEICAFLDERVAEPLLLEDVLISMSDLIRGRVAMSSGTSPCRARGRDPPAGEGRLRSVLGKRVAVDGGRRRIRALERRKGAQIRERRRRWRRAAAALQGAARLRHEPNDSRRG